MEVDYKPCSCKMYTGTKLWDAERAPMICVITWGSNKGNKSNSTFLTTEHCFQTHRAYKMNRMKIFFHAIIKPWNLLA